MVTLSAAASNTIFWSGRVNGVNTICSAAVSRVRTWSKVLPGGQPLIAQIGPPMRLALSIAAACAYRRWRRG
jgi:hypothetical protein